MIEHLQNMLGPAVTTGSAKYGTCSKLLLRGCGLQEKELRAQHALQLDAVHFKLQTVLAKKDATIQALKSELDAALINLQQLEEDDESS